MVKMCNKYIYSIAYIQNCALSKAIKSSGGKKDESSVPAPADMSAASCHDITVGAKISGTVSQIKPAFPP